MSTKTKQSQSQAGRRRKHAEADRRRRDRALVPVVIAQRVGISVADLARAMRAASVCRQLAEAEAADWICQPKTAPAWLTTVVGERLARAVEAEYRREQAEEERQLRELAVEQAAWAKVQAGRGGSVTTSGCLRTTGRSAQRKGSSAAARKLTSS